MRIGGGPSIFMTFFCLALAVAFLAGTVYFAWATTRFHDEMKSAEKGEDIAAYRQVRNASVLFCGLSLIATGLFASLAWSARRRWKATSTR